MDQTIVIIEAGTNIEYDIFTLADPPRLVIDLHEILPGNIAESQEVNSQWVQRYRLGEFNTDPLVTRLVLDLNEPVGYNTISANDGQVLNIELQPAAPVYPVTGYLVFIDPGDGGRSPGAPGYSRSIWEREVNLDTSLRLAQILRQQGAQVQMSRSADITVELDERVVMANASGADIFVSVHANANYNSEISGIMTFHRRQSLPASQRLAESIQTTMVNELRLVDRGVRQANFVVIRDTVMPSVLVEQAFLSNPVEEKLLADGNFRQQVAEAIAQGINKYFEG